MVSTITLWKLRPKVEAERGPAPLKPVVVDDDGLYSQIFSGFRNIQSFAQYTLMDASTM
jgi:hypothetical protein